MLASWLYRSRARTRGQSRAEALVYVTSQRNNARLGITGCLYRSAHLYVQYLEGSALSLNRLSRRIRADPCHDCIEDLVWGVLPRRLFAAWGMAFTDEGTVSFAAFARDRDCPDDLGIAATSDILAFMEDAATRSLGGIEANQSRILQAAGRGGQADA